MLLEKVFFKCNLSMLQEPHTKFISPLLYWRRRDPYLKAASSKSETTEITFGMSGKIFLFGWTDPLAAGTPNTMRLRFNLVFLDCDFYTSAISFQICTKEQVNCWTTWSPHNQVGLIQARLPLILLTLSKFHSNWELCSNSAWGVDTQTPNSSLSEKNVHWICRCHIVS